MLEAKMVENINAPKVGDNDSNVEVILNIFPASSAATIFAIFVLITMVAKLNKEPKKANNNHKKKQNGTKFDNTNL